jgi:hypothetical protein
MSAVKVVVLQDVEVAGVRVPGVVVDLDAVPEQVPGHVDEAHAGLDESSRDQRTLPEQVPAIAIDAARVLIAQVKRRLDLRRQDEVERAAAQAVVVAGTIDLASPFINLLEQRSPRAEAVDGHAGFEYAIR